MSKIAHFRARIKRERKLIPEWSAERCRAEAADCRRLRPPPALRNHHRGDAGGTGAAPVQPGLRGCAARPGERGGGNPYGERGGAVKDAYRIPVRFPTAEIRFVCNNEGGVRVDFQRDSDANEISTGTAVAIERLVRVCMKARGEHRAAIEAAVNMAEQAQKEQAQ